MIDVTEPLYVQRPFWTITLWNASTIPKCHTLGCTVYQEQSVFQTSLSKYRLFFAQACQSLNLARSRAYKREPFQLNAQLTIFRSVDLTGIRSSDKR